MKILSCYITGFGCFVNQGFDFHQNLNLLKADNGFGKTTLATFIKAMFYGLDASRNRAVEENERAKYAPWSGAAFGGSLVFLYQNQRYTIERSFGKTPSEDTCRLYDQNRSLCKISGGSGESLGEKFFGVDKESFEKTAFIPQEVGRGEKGAPDTLLARLSAIFSQSEERGDARAMARLEEAERKLRAKRKPAKGKLDEIDERLQNLSLQEMEAENAKTQAEELKAKLQETMGAGLRSTQKNGKLPHKKGAKYIALFSLVCMLVGVGIIVSHTAVGICVIALGIVAFLIAFAPKNQEGQTKRLQEDAENRGRTLEQIDLLQAKAATLNDIQEEIASTLQEKTRLEKRLKAIQKAKEILSQAKTGAAMKYLEAVEKTCKNYAEFLGLNANGFSLNANAEGSVQENGIIREMGFYSAGMQALYSLCVRLALAEAVYTAEMPPLIFDDPLVHLDDEKTEKAKAILREFSKKYQIIYFTCKEERRL